MRLKTMPSRMLVLQGEDYVAKPLYWPLFLFVFNNSLPVLNFSFDEAFSLFPSLVPYGEYMTYCTVLVI